MHLVTYRTTMRYLDGLDDNAIIGKTNNCFVCPFANMILDMHNLAYVSVVPNEFLDDAEYTGARVYYKRTDNGNEYMQALPKWVARAMYRIDTPLDFGEGNQGVIVRPLTVRQFRKIIREVY